MKGIIMGKVGYNEIVDVLKNKYSPEKIILFGSCVSGRINRDSDIDMLIIKKTKKTYGERWLEVGRLVRAINKKMPFEPIVLTPQELASQSLNNLFIREILKSGKVLYEKG